MMRGMLGRLTTATGRLRAWMNRRRVPAWLAGDRDPLGPMGEDAAAKHLRTRGMTILGRNVRSPAGEADILAEDSDRRTIVIVEVKTRRVEQDSRNPPPERSVDAAKRRRLIRVARHFARANAWGDRPVRIDVIAVEWHDDREPVIRHHVGVIWVQRGRG
jgi:putative endonuclease